jgi:formate dehydrogenase subunit delta
VNPDNLVKMANQIALFFESQSGPDAAAGIAEHLKKFWDPRMRQAIIRHALEGGAGLRETTAKAVALLDAPRP